METPNVEDVNTVEGVTEKAHYEKVPG